MFLNLSLVLGLCSYVLLESTDVALEVPHPRLTRLPARWSAFALFFFFFFRGFVPTWLDSRRHGSIRAEIGFDSCRIGFDSCRIGPYRPYRVVLAGGQNRPETAEIYRKRPKSALNMARKAETCLLFFFLFFFVLFFVNQGIVTCFSRIF